MPINAIELSAAIQAAYPFSGASIQFPQIATAISTAVFNWVQLGEASCGVTGVCTGTAGAGTCTGKLAVPAGALTAVSTFATYGLKEPAAVAIATAIGNGVAAHFSMAGMYVGISAGVGVGADAAKITIANQPSLYAQLQITLPAALGGSGYLLPVFGQATAAAVCAVLLTSTPVPGVVAGSPSPSGATGASISRVV